MRRMKQLRAAKKAATPTAALERALERRAARGHVCIDCGQKFDRADRLVRHREQSSCFARANKKADNESARQRIARRDRGLIDPERPELGRVTKNSLLALMLAKKK